MKSLHNVFLSGLTVAIIGYLVGPSIGTPFAPNFALGALVSTFVSILVLKITLKSTVTTDEKDSNSETETCTLYVGNLPYKANEMDVQKLFEQYGSVISVRLMKDRYTGKRRGFGFIVMDASTAETAIEQLNGAEFGQRNLKVKEANEPKPKEKKALA